MRAKKKRERFESTNECRLGPAGCMRETNNKNFSQSLSHSISLNNYREEIFPKKSADAANKMQPVICWIVFYSFSLRRMKLTTKC